MIPGIKSTGYRGEISGKIELGDSVAVLCVSVAEESIVITSSPSVSMERSFIGGIGRVFKKFHWAA